MSHNARVSSTRKTTFHSYDAFLVEYPILAAVDCLSPIGALLNISALSNLYFNQLVTAWESTGRLGPPPVYRIFNRRMLISWAMWLSFLGRACHAVGFSCAAMDGLLPFHLSAVLGKKENWLLWGLATLGSLFVLLETILLMSNAQDPWYCICLPFLMFKARAKLTGLQISFAFWGGFSLALGCLGLFEMGFSEIGGDALNLPFSTSFGFANVLFAVSNLCAVLGFIGRRKDAISREDFGIPQALTLSVEKAIAADIASNAIAGAGI